MTLPLMLTARGIFSLHQWLIILIIARSGAAEALGLIGLALAIATPVNALFGLGLRQSVATDLPAEFPPRAYWALRLAGFLPALGLVLLIAGFWFRNHSGLVPVVLAISAMKAADLGSELCYGFWQRRGRLARVAVSQMLRAAAGFTAFGIAFLTGAGLVAAICAWAGAWVLVLICLDLRPPASAGQGGADGAPRNLLRRSLSLALVQMPFGLAAGVTLAGLAMPRLMLAGVADLETLGRFSAIFIMFQAGPGFVTAAVQTRLSPLARAFQQSDPNKARAVITPLFRAVAFLSLGMVLILWPAGGPLLVMMYGPDFAGLSGVFALLAIGWAARCTTTVLRSVYHAQRQFWTGFTFDLLGAGLTAGSCGIALVFYPGMTSISLGFAAAQVVHMLVLSAATARVLPGFFRFRTPQSPGQTHTR